MNTTKPLLDDVLLTLLKQSTKYPEQVTVDYEPIKQAKQTILSDLLQVIGEDERIDIQSDFDKIDVPHLETDKYPGLDGVRQASRNLLRAKLREAIRAYVGVES